LIPHGIDGIPARRQRRIAVFETLQGFADRLLAAAVGGFCGFLDGAPRQAFN
jgi:hypothetical protein